MNHTFTIDCGDILLRPFRSEDADAIYELTSQPEVYQFLPDWQSTREQRQEWVTNYEIPDNERFLASVPHIGENWLKLAVILKETGELIGFCNTGIKEELSGSNREVAYAMSTHHTKRGYTTLAVKALIQYLFSDTKTERLNAVVLPHNHASRKVIEKCGFDLQGEVKIDDKVHLHYVIDKD
ncbi:GNAT family N-acetyltransferase [Jeotgalibacillus haloalkalitolerans]|uniref:GNAT family N-acetyltransferase n=1 Tax=Jeotgalibacillus haloalkalitolerans TaxID=3104292 RepID=A0ABU5KHL2_9BACL|nr:GNAT family N-acetyltransferase [Jeotgalibacillus sp. HH7-29]MDZ5710708.1 GNAT family N-acetyltransferase [Jeotgalibacillus sp. HH7-29]